MAQHEQDHACHKCSDINSSSSSRLQKVDFLTVILETAPPKGYPQTKQTRRQQQQQQKRLSRCDRFSQNVTLGRVFFESSLFGCVSTGNKSGNKKRKTTKTNNKLVLFLFLFFFPRGGVFSGQGGGQAGGRGGGSLIFSHTHITSAHLATQLAGAMLLTLAEQQACDQAASRKSQVTRGLFLALVTQRI